MGPEEFVRWVGEVGLPLPSGAPDLLVAYHKELVAEALVQNLIGPGTLDDVWGKHFADSVLGLVALTAAKDYRDVPRGTLPAFEGARVLDIGSGAGLPGIPLKILRPDFRTCLLEPRLKRASFLERVTQAIGLEGVEVLPQRAEDAARKPGYRESFDLVTARAVSDLTVLLEYGLPFIHEGGILICYKGPSVTEELERAKAVSPQLGGVLEGAPNYLLPEGIGARTIVLFRKVSQTPARFPRRAGIPEKRPLGTQPK